METRESVRLLTSAATVLGRALASISMMTSLTLGSSANNSPVANSGRTIPRRALPRPLTANSGDYWHEAGETRTGFLVYPAGTYREAQVSIEDVETEETEGFATPVR